MNLTTKAHFARLYGRAIVKASDRESVEAALRSAMSRITGAVDSRTVAALMKALVKSKRRR